MDIIFHPAAREEAHEGYLYYGVEDETPAYMRGATITAVP
jgi:hypothetical protein